MVTWQPYLWAAQAHHQRKLKLQAASRLRQPMLADVYGKEPVWTLRRLMRATFIALIGGFVAGAPVARAPRAGAGSGEPRAARTAEDVARVSRQRKCWVGSRCVPLRLAGRKAHDLGTALCCAEQHEAGAAERSGARAARRPVRHRRRHDHGPAAARVRAAPDDQRGHVWHDGARVVVHRRLLVRL